jgi:glutathione S-transferase
MIPENRLQLYHWTAAGHSAVALLCLRAKALPFESVWVDLLSLQQYSKDILKLHPGGQVPFVIHYGNVIHQTTAIAEYLEDCFPSPSLTPSTVVDRWRMRVWLKIFNEDIAPSIAQLAWYGVTRPHIGPDAVEKLRGAIDHIRIPERKAAWTLACEPDTPEAQLDPCRRKLRTVVTRLEVELSRSMWAAGPALSLADLHLFPMLVPVRRLLPEDLNSRTSPRIIEWFSRMWDQPAVMETFGAPGAEQLMSQLVPGEEPVRWG